VRDDELETAVEWCQANPEIANGYLGSKQALIVYTKLRASQARRARDPHECAASRRRPDTPMLPQFYEQAAAARTSTSSSRRRSAAPPRAEMGDPLILLNSDAARSSPAWRSRSTTVYCGEVHVGVRQGDCCRSRAG